MNDVDTQSGEVPGNAPDGQAMGEQKKEITGEEYLLIGLVLLKKLHEALTDPHTPNKITISEWMAIVSAAGGKAWKEYND